jgi:hypothetical protein
MFYYKLFDHEGIRQILTENPTLDEYLGRKFLENKALLRQQRPGPNRGDVIVKMLVL